jgi:hypothetical protein
MASPTLVSANISFHTNDDDKNDDSIVNVYVSTGSVEGGNYSIVAQIEDRFGHFPDHSDSGPFDLVIIDPQITRDRLKIGNVLIQLVSHGSDTWRFNFFLDLRFSDGSHLIARGNGLQLSRGYPDVGLGIE